MITVARGDSQFINYAKGHYVRTNLMADVRKLVAKRALISLDTVNDADVLGVIVSILEHLQLGPRMLRGGFMENVVFGRYFGIIQKEQKPIENFVQAALGLLYELTINDAKWEKADPAYLPLSPELLKRRAEDSNF
jgi:hypothetical protein